MVYLIFISTPLFGINEIAGLADHIIVAGEKHFIVIKVKVKIDSVGFFGGSPFGVQPGVKDLLGGFVFQDLQQVALSDRRIFVDLHIGLKGNTKDLVVGENEIYFDRIRAVI
jgi:hypothetical protein